MGEVKAQTMIQKMGFVDSDKKSPEHDKIQIWCYKNIKTVISALDKLDLPSIEASNPKMEYQIIQSSHGGNKFVIGFIDMHCVLATKKDSERFISLKKECDNLINTKKELILKLDGEKKVLKASLALDKDNTDYWGEVKDSVAEWRALKDNHKKQIDELERREVPAQANLRRLNDWWQNVFIEIKTKIPSIGELIRQVNFYRTYIGNDAPFIVVCPDDSCADILKGQGIYFYKYQDETKLF